MRLPCLCFLEQPRNESPILTLSTFKDNDGTPGETESRWGYFRYEWDPGGLSPTPGLSDTGVDQRTATFSFFLLILLNLLG